MKSNNREKRTENSKKTKKENRKHGRGYKREKLKRLLELSQKSKWIFSNLWAGRKALPHPK